MNINEHNKSLEDWFVYDPANKHLPENIWHHHYTNHISKTQSDTEKAAAGVIVSVLKGFVLLYVGLGVLFCLACLWFGVL